MMDIAEKVIAAAKLLYGGAEAAAGVCGADMELLWESDALVTLLHPILLNQLCCTNGQKLILPPNGELTVTEKRRTFRCRILPMVIEEQSFYLLELRPQEPERQISGGELQTLFSAYSTDLRLVCSDLLQANDSMLRLGAQQWESGRNAVQMIHNSVYRLLNQSARCAELAWYENFPKSRLRSVPAVDVSAVLYETMEEIRYVMGDYIAVELPAALREMPARVDAERLHFALLNIFVVLHDGNPNRTEYTCTAVRKAREIRITLTAANKESVRTKVPRLHKQKYCRDSETAASAKALLERFCTAFHAQAEFTVDKNAAVCVLRLPSHKTQNQQLEFSSDRENMKHNRFALPYLLISPIVDYPPKSK